MEYKEFISKLYIKGAWSQKAKLTRDLFLSTVNDTSVITDNRNSDASYKGYNRGNSISAIATDVISDLNEKGIKNFLKKYFNSYPEKKDEYVQIICKRFKDDISDITAENICEKIAVFFIDAVLRPVVKETEQEDTTPAHHLNSAQAQVSEPATAVDDSTEQDNNSLHYSNHTENFYDNHTDNYYENTTNINETSLSSVTNNIPLINDNRSNTITINTSSKSADELVGLKALINELNVRFIDLKDKGIALHSPFAHRTDEEQKVKEQEFESLRAEFMKENKELRYYYLTFPELRELFEEMLSLSATLTFEVGFTNNSKNQSIAFQIVEYEKSINKLRKMLFK